LSASSTLQRALNDVVRGRRFRVLLPKMAWFWLSPAIARLCRSTPDLSFRAYQDDDVVDLDASDFAIVASGHVPPAGFQGAALYDERLIPVCSPAFAAQTEITTASGLARASLLISQPDHWTSWFSHAGFVSEPSVSGPLFTDATLALDAALRGQGVALCCTLAAAAAVSRGELVSPVQVSSGTDRRLWAVWKDARSGPAMPVLNWLLAELETSRTDHASVVEDVVPRISSVRWFDDEADKTKSLRRWSPISAPAPQISAVCR